MQNMLNTYCKMAKRGRKPKERKGYFYEKEEQAIVDYIHETDKEKKNQIFNTILYPALSKMIESIIRRYKLFVPDEEFEQNFNDTISYLLTKINHYRERITGYTMSEKVEGVEYVPMEWDELVSKFKNATDEDPEYVVVSANTENEQCCIYYHKVVFEYKAYSYCGTVCRNYLMYKCSQYTKKRMRNTPYDEVFEEISNSSRYSTDEDNNADRAASLIKNTADEIESMIQNAEEHELTKEEIIVGKALINLMRNWEDMLPTNGSNKLQKSSVLYFLREETMMTTKEVRDHMKKYKAVYNLLKKASLE